MVSGDSADDLGEACGAFITVLAMICNRLIEHDILNRDDIKSDLAAEVERMRDSDPSAVKEMILSGLAFALHAPRPSESPIQRSRPAGPRDEEIIEIVQIDDATERLKLIGSDD